jgi:hypothetical protein
MSELAASSAKNRENLYRMLSEEGNPRLDSLRAVTGAMGLRLIVVPQSQSENTLPDDFDFSSFNSDMTEAVPQEDTRGAAATASSVLLLGWVPASSAANVWSAGTITAQHQATQYIVDFFSNPSEVSKWRRTSLPLVANAQTPGSSRSPITP